MSGLNNTGGWTYVTSATFRLSKNKLQYLRQLTSSSLKNRQSHTLASERVWSVKKNPLLASFRSVHACRSLLSSHALVSELCTCRHFLCAAAFAQQRRVTFTCPQARDELRKLPDAIRFSLAEHYRCIVYIYATSIKYIWRA